MKLLVVIPAYNEEELILKTVDNLKKYNYDYVVINDASTDKTKRILIENNLNYLSLPTNVGLDGVVKLGMQYAYEFNYDAVLQFDGDGQHLPEYIEQMLVKLKDFDIVIGSRFVNEKKPKSLRMIGNRMISFAIKLTTNKNIKDPTSGMRMYKGKLIEAYAKYSNYTPEPDTLVYMINKGYTVAEVQVSMEERLAGESYLNFSRSIKYMFHMFSSIFFIQWFRK